MTAKSIIAYVKVLSIAEHKKILGSKNSQGPDLNPDYESWRPICFYMTKWARGSVSKLTALDRR